MKQKYVDPSQEMWMLEATGLDRYRTNIALPRDKAKQLMELYLDALIITEDYQDNVEEIARVTNVRIKVITKEQLEIYNTKQVLTGEDTK